MHEYGAMKEKPHGIVFDNGRKIATLGIFGRDKIQEHSRNMILECIGAVESSETIRWRTTRRLFWVSSL